MSHECEEDEVKYKKAPVTQYSPNPRRSGRFDSPYSCDDDRWHISDGTGYVVIAEFKEDEPLVYETYLHYSTFERAKERMRQLSQTQGIIRVAIAKLVYVDGNHALVDNRRIS